MTVRNCPHKLSQGMTPQVYKCAPFGIIIERILSEILNKTLTFMYLVKLLCD